MYNDANAEEKIILTKEIKDVSNIYICVYNYRHIGLFEKIDWNTEKTYDASCDRWNYDAVGVYVGMDSDYVGINLTHYNHKRVYQWQEIGSSVTINNKTYVANCNMQNKMSFNDMRRVMYNDGEIDSYEIGKVSLQELLEVLKYAQHYYGICSDEKGSVKKYTGN